MKKKLDTRFPAARIKKIMQADEDVGKIAMAVPVLVSKALELFLQDLCDRTYDITLRRGAKTVSALHLKHCVQSYNVFDFLREVVSKVPDYGHSDTGAEVSRRRKVAMDELNDSDDESKRSRTETCPASSGGRGRGRGRARGRGRGARADREPAHHHDVESDSCASIQHSCTQNPNPNPGMLKETCLESKEPLRHDPNATDGGDKSAVKNINPNISLDESAEKPNTCAATATATACSSLSMPPDVKDSEGTVLSEIDRMAVDPLHFAQFNSNIVEEEEDYDDEG